ncbi:MAG: DUF4258 domain-containing protein [Chloroflexota bacterium]|nr:DUF4258 domain-containing protein [Chloroflexota bacterium]
MEKTGDEPAIIYTGHSRTRMAERRISEDDVRQIVMNYDTRRPASPRHGASPTEILIGWCRWRRLRVYIVRGSDPLAVKTAAWE